MGKEHSSEARMNKRPLAVIMFLIAALANALLLSVLGKGLSATPVSVYRLFFVIVIAVLAVILVGEALNRLINTTNFPTGDIYEGEAEDYPPGHLRKPIPSNDKMKWLLAMIAFSLFMQIGPDK